MNTFTGNVVQAMAACIEDANKKVLKACIETVNTQAGMARKQAIQNIQSDFINRNKFTASSVRFTQCPKSVKRLEDVESRTGITQRADYMNRQEHGGQHRNAKGNQLGIPTAYARGGSNSGKVKQKYMMGKMGSVKGEFTRAKTRRSETVARAYVAYREKIVMKHDNKAFVVTSFRKKGDSVNFQLREVYTFEYASTTTKAKPWLEPATVTPMQQGQNIFNSKMD